MEDYRFYRWLDAFLQPASILAIVVLPIVWAAIFYEISEDQHRAEEQGTRTTKSIVRLLENQVHRTIRRIDGDLVALQNSFPKNPTEDALAAWLKSPALSGSLQISFLDSQGILRASNHGTPAAADLSERGYFRHFAEGGSNDLAIGRASAARVLGSTGMRLARRVTGQDQEFAGVIVAAMESEPLDDFHNTLGAGSSVTVALLGLDGTLQAGRGAGIVREGAALRWEHADARLANAAQHTSYGHFWSKPHDRPDVDSTLIAYRMVDEYPLLVAAAIPGKRVFAGQAHSEFVYNATGWGITFALLAAIYLATSRDLKFKAAARSLADTNARFRTSLANMPHGLCMFDGDGRLVICNQSYADMYRLPQEAVRPGTTLRAILDARAETGSCPADADAYIKNFLHDIASRAPQQLICELRDGRTIAVDYQPMADGGFVTVHQDFPQQRATEAKIAFLALHDPLTGLLNRASLLEKIDEHLARSHRHSGKFTLLLLDLDRFKQVND